MAAHDLSEVIEVYLPADVQGIVMIRPVRARAVRVGSSSKTDDMGGSSAAQNFQIADTWRTRGEGSALRTALLQIKCT